MPEMSVDALRNDLSNPARSYLWELIIPNLIATMGDPRTMMIRCQTAELPDRSVGTIQIPFRQTAGLVFPGKLTMSHTVDLQFVEGEDRKIFNALYVWSNAIVNNKTGKSSGEGFGLGLPINTGVRYKADVFINLLNTNGVIAQIIRLTGCFVQNVAKVPLNNEESEIKINATLSYDTWENYPVEVGLGLLDSILN